MKIPFWALVGISRPRFWLYTAGPFLIGIVSTDLSVLQWIWHFPFIVVVLGLLFFYFLFPANLLIYGVNDIADGDTDTYNLKKQWYETSLQQQHHKALSRQILLWAIIPWIVISMLLYLWLLYYLSNWFTIIWNTLDLLMNTGRLFVRVGVSQRLILLVFWLLAYSYSSPPIRAKAIPFLDWLTNILYIVPGIFVYDIIVWIEYISWWYVIGWWMWCMAMHAYSAIPDIEPDQQAGIKTTAVYLWKKGTLLYCAILWIWAAFTISRPFPLFALCAWAVYTFMIALSGHRPVIEMYKLFPWINGVIWFVLFWLIVLSQ